MSSTRPAKHYRGRTAVCGIGVAAYWPRFPGLQERLEDHQEEVEHRIEALDVEIAAAGLVEKFHLDGNGYARLGAGLILGNSLITSRGVPASPWSQSDKGDSQ